MQLFRYCRYGRYYLDIAAVNLKNRQSQRLLISDKKVSFVTLERLRKRHAIKCNLTIMADF